MSTLVLPKIQVVPLKIIGMPSHYLTFQIPRSLMCNLYAQHLIRCQLAIILISYINIFFQSVIMLVFREEKSPEDEIKAWQFWHARQHSVKQRILDAGEYILIYDMCFVNVKKKYEILWAPLMEHYAFPPRLIIDMLRKS